MHSERGLSCIVNSIQQWSTAYQCISNDAYCFLTRDQKGITEKNEHSDCQCAIVKLANKNNLCADSRISQDDSL